jgi:hypothetical protein
MALTGHVDDWEELAIDYLDGTLDPTGKAAVDAHLETCPACAARLGVQRTVCAALKRIPLEDTPPELEDQVIGEILFPTQPRRAGVAPVKQRADWSRALRRRFRPWIPVTVAVVAFFAVIISIGVLRSGGLDEAISTTAAPASLASAPKAQDTAAGAMTTAAPATTMAAASVESASNDSGPSGFGAGAPTTTAGPTATNPAETTVALTGTQDKKAMVAELQAASGPVYFVFETTAESAADGATGAALAEQMAAFTGLQPLQGDLAIAATSFAAYVPKKDASALVDLLEAISTSLGLSLNLVTEPIRLHDSTRSADYPSALRQNGALLPELNAARTPQPAITKYSFTTSTVVADASQLPPGWVPPDAAGTHALVVIYLGE